MRKEGESAKSVNEMLLTKQTFSIWSLPVSSTRCHGWSHHLQHSETGSSSYVALSFPDLFPCIALFIYVLLSTYSVLYKALTYAYLTFFFLPIIVQIFIPVNTCRLWTNLHEPVRMQNSPIFNCKHFIIITVSINQLISCFAYAL